MKTTLRKNLLTMLKTLWIAILVPEPIQADTPSYHFTAAEIAAYDSEVTNAQLLIKDGENLLNRSGVPSFYDLVKGWEDNCYKFLSDFDEHHQYATDFSWRFQYYGKQIRPTNMSELTGIILDILNQNIATLRNVRAHAIKCANEARARQE